jgi:hypothetical protein
MEYILLDPGNGGRGTQVCEELYMSGVPVAVLYISLPTLCRHFYIHPRTNNCNFHAPFRYLLVPAALLLPTPAGVALGTLIIPLSTGVHLTAEPHPQEA